MRKDNCTTKQFYCSASKSDTANISLLKIINFDSVILAVEEKHLSVDVILLAQQDIHLLNVSREKIMLLSSTIPMELILL